MKKTDPKKPVTKLKRGPDQQRRISLLWGRHKGADAFVVGTGTSLAGFDFRRLASRLTIGLNDALMIRDLKPAFSIFCDTGIWKRYAAMKLDPRTIVVCQTRSRDMFLRHEPCTFRDQVWHFNHVSTAAAQPQKRGKVTISCKQENDDLYVARTVATAGIMMAYKLGARRVFLLGVDGYKIEGPDGGIYYHNGSGKGPEHRKEKPVGDDTDGDARVRDRARITQDRHDWWRKNMDELRRWFDHFGAYQDAYVYRNPVTREKRYGSGVFNLSGRSTINTWQKVKVRTVLGSRCFKD